MFKVSGISVKAGQKALLSNIHLAIEPQSITAIMGANGAGKSTLFKSLLGEYALCSGHVEFNGKRIDNYSLHELSLKRAYISQANTAMFSMLVLEYLLLARSQYLESVKDSENIVLGIAEQFNVMDFLMRDMTTLSGGECQIIEFVRAYLQLYEGDNMRGKCLLLDEPASALDIKQTRRLYRHLMRFQEQQGTVIVIDHDINQVASLAHHAVLIKSGEVLASGSIDSVFTQNTLDECFATRGKLIRSKAHQTSFYHLGFVNKAY